MAEGIARATRRSGGRWPPVQAAHVLGDRNRKRGREATTVLHPIINIVTIFEIGTTDEVMSSRWESRRQDAGEFLTGGALPLATVLAGAQVPTVAGPPPRSSSRSQARTLCHRRRAGEGSDFAWRGRRLTPNRVGPATGRSYHAAGRRAGAAAPCRRGGLGQAVDFGLIARAWPQAAELTTGRQPSRRETAVQTMSAIIDVTHQRLSPRRERRSSARIVDRPSEPEDRYGST